MKDRMGEDQDDHMDVWRILERITEIRMIRWMCGVSLKELQTSTELGRRSGVGDDWGCKEKVRTEVALTCGKDEQCRQGRGTLRVDGGGLPLEEEDLAGRCVI